MKDLLIIFNGLLSAKIGGIIQYFETRGLRDSSADL